MKPDLFKIFMTVQPSEVHCEGCPFLDTWYEKYNIGDSVESETEVNCSGTYLDCFRVQDIAQDLECFIEDNQSELNLLKV